MSSSAFNAPFSHLNARQREAVEHPDGPVLVVAGPGTGKTQLLAARVAWLLQQPDVQPEQLLCLTYTEAAAQNMRERLRRLIGSVADQVAIHTYHSFGQLVIQENAESRGQVVPAVASELELRQLYVGLIDALPAGHPLRRDTSSPYYEIKRLAPLFQLMKREGWSPSQVVQELEAYRKGLPDQEAFQFKNKNAKKGIKAGDPHPIRLAEEEERIELSIAAAELFDAYKSALRERGRYDFDDMLAWSTALLTEHPGLLQRYQNSYRHVLVDEYQDTNGAQNNLLHLLANHSDRPNVMAVGDDDQSIYRFQGANVANMLDFTKRYPTARVVVLEDNYRSSPAVLAAAAGLIDHNQQRLTQQIPGLSKRLVARHPHFALSTVAAPLVREYASPQHEAEHVAAEVAALHCSGWPAGGAAIITRDHKQLDLVAQLLSNAGVSFYRKRQVDVLAEEGLAVELHQVLQYLAAALVQNQAAAEPALFVLLHLPCLGVPPTDLVRLAAGRRLRFGSANLKTPNADLSWRTWVAQAVDDEELAAEMQLSGEGRQALRDALVLVDEWLRVAATQPLPALVELICQETLLGWHLSRHAQPDRLRAVEQALQQFAEAEARRDPGLDAKGFLAVWEALAETPKGLVLETAEPETAALHLRTAHGAKGLEFERVWVLGCQEKIWNKTWKPARYRLPPHMQPANSEVEESRRLFFVAITRAQEHLTLSYSRVNAKGEESGRCCFIGEVLDATGPESTAVIVADESDELLRVNQAAVVPPVPLPDKALLDRLLSNFSLSASTLNAYLRCSVGCYYEHLLRVPGVRGEALLFGSAVHEALEAFFKTAQGDPVRGFGHVDELVAAFDTWMANHRAELSPAAYRRRRHAGQVQLRAYHAHW